MQELSRRQRLRYGSNRNALRRGFQGVDGARRHGMAGVNPQGCQVFGFKHPGATELDRGLLGRTTRSRPEPAGKTHWRERYPSIVDLKRPPPRRIAPPAQGRA